ncbi:hypothetical protein [Microbispora sp. NBRC 16548]|uniref:hypothetical protein n=1 Tax=Microbispora sp. NBRC 16548 TaxID=3030994 RepID=UPI0024A04DDD|nr:hypothetical protein [Microbispora sp. NBRC 16548]GLX11687.1 hypothetical protein Misp03_86130 [Microbispora sp. NBRC 16548]
MTLFPTENQQRLLVAHGLDRWFGAQWVSIEDGHEVARRLHFPAETIETCDFQTAMRSYDPLGSAQRVWITSHAPGWSHVLLLSGGQASSAEELSRHGQRVFELSYVGEIEELDEPIYTHDGEYRSIFDEAEYEAYRTNLSNDNTMPVSDLEQLLIIIGRITGRFLDQDWVSSQGLLCVIP